MTTLIIAATAAEAKTLRPLPTDHVMTDLEHLSRFVAGRAFGAAQWTERATSRTRCEGHRGACGRCDLRAAVEAALLRDSGRP